MKISKKVILKSYEPGIDRNPKRKHGGSFKKRKSGMSKVYVEATFFDLYSNASSDLETEKDLKRWEQYRAEEIKKIADFFRKTKFKSLDLDYLSIDGKVLKS